MEWISLAQEPPWGNDTRTSKWMFVWTVRVLIVGIGAASQIGDAVLTIVTCPRGQAHVETFTASFVAQCSVATGNIAGGQPTAILVVASTVGDIRIVLGHCGGVGYQMREILSGELMKDFRDIRWCLE